MFACSAWKKQEACSGRRLILWRDPFIYINTGIHPGVGRRGEAEPFQRFGSDVGCHCYSKTVETVLLAPATSHPAEAGC